MKTVALGPTLTTFKPEPFRPMPKAPQLAAPHARAPFGRAMAPRKAELGQGHYDSTQLPHSIGVGLLGAGAIVIAGALPTPLKEVATVGGLVTLGYSVLKLFSGKAPAEAPSGDATPFPAASADQFGAVTAKILKPSYAEEVNRGFLSKDYDVEVLWTNHSDKAVTVPYRIYVEETPEGGVMVEPFKGVAYTGKVQLGPKESVTVPMEIDLQYRNIGIMVAQAVGIVLKVQKISSNGQVFDADQRTFFVY